MAQTSTTLDGGRTSASPAQRSRPSRSKNDERPQVTLPLLGTVTMPPPDRLVFYAVLGVLGVMEIVEWPVVLIVGVGHYLSEQRRSPLLRQAGEAAQAA